MHENIEEIFYQFLVEKGVLFSFISNLKYREDFKTFLKTTDPRSYIDSAFIFGSGIGGFQF
jgi:hypothetical protein